MTIRHFTLLVFFWFAVVGSLLARRKPGDKGELGPASAGQPSITHWGLILQFLGIP